MFVWTEVFLTIRHAQSGSPDESLNAIAREVLGLYRKREGARRLHEHGVFARFRYNDLKEAARGCGGRGPYANSMVGRSGVELCRGCAAERDT